MKRICKVVLVLILCTGLVGCGRDSKSKEKSFIDDSDIKEMYSNPKKYDGKYVTLTGKIFSGPDTGEGAIAFQMWGDPKNNDLNTMIYSDKEIAKDVGADDYVKVTGYIDGEFEGENRFGGTITAPQIVAEKIEVSSYQEVMSPTLKTIGINSVKASNGVTVTLQKIEFAKNEARLYVSIDNQSGYKYNFYSFNTKIVQNGKQFEEENNYDADYPEISNEILTGVKTEGIISYKAIEQSNFQWVCEGNSDNYDFDNDTFTFDVTVN